MIPRRHTTLLILAATLATLAGCAGSTAHYVHPDVDFGYIRRTAVLPFQNLSTDRFATLRLQSVFLGELLTHEGLEVVEPGETLQAYGTLRLNPDAVLTPEQIIAIGQALEVDAVFLGSVQEYGIERSGRSHAVTAAFSLAETTTGATVWSAQARADGSSFWRALFGGDGASLYDVSREVVRKALETLFE